MHATTVGSPSPKSSSAHPREYSAGGRGEPIRMEGKRYGYFPQTFLWRERRYDVLAVEQCRTVSSQWSSEVEQHYFHVRCTEGTFDLYQDIKHDIWYLDHFEQAQEHVQTVTRSADLQVEAVATNVQC